MPSHKKGFIVTLELLILSGVILFFVLSPMAYYTMLMSSMSSASVYNSVIQDLSVCGGYDERVERNLYENLLIKGLINSLGKTTVDEVIIADKARSKPQVIVECSANINAGDSPVYRSYSAESDSRIMIRISVLQSKEKAFLNTVGRIIGITPSGGEYIILSGWIMSELPEPVY